jgi:hypothetical protein
MMSRINMARWATLVCTSLNILPCVYRSQVTRMNHDGKALNGSSRASAPVGCG